MITVKVPKDIRKYKPRLIFGLTLRQIVCGVLYFIYVCVLHTWVMKPYELTIEVMKWPLFFGAVLIFGFLIEPYDMPMEQFLNTVLLSRFWSPSRRLAKTVLIKPEKKRNRKKRILSRKQKEQIYLEHPEYKPYR